MRSLGRVLARSIRPLVNLPDAWSWWEIVLRVGGWLGAVALPAWLVTWVKGLPASPWLLAFVVIILVLLIGNAAVQLDTQIEAYEKWPKPRLVLDRPFVDQRDLCNALGIVEARPYFAHVLVRNDPGLRKAEAAANHVIARISFFGAGDCDPLFTIDGRWGDTEQPATRSPFAPISDLRRMHFPPNGETHELNVAIKYREDEECYAFNNESCRIPGWRNRDWGLQGQEFRVRVTLQGEGMDKDEMRWFVLRNMGKGSGIELVYLASQGEELASDSY
jgi:hypothetical protein